MNPSRLSVIARRQWLGTELLARAGAWARRECGKTVLVAAILTAACAAFLVTAPVAGDFWWSDAPRHALNGAFVKDFVTAFPWRDPRGWAVDYYLRYPALTILIYPPFFYSVEAAVYTAMGVNHLAAQITVTLFTLLLAAGSYGLARLVLERWSALGVSLLVIGAPEVAFWARQVMLDIRAYAALVVGVLFFAKYIRFSRTRYLYLAVLCNLAAVYTRFTTVFILPVLVTVLFATRGRGALRDRDTVLAGTFGALGLVPALYLTWRFGTVNLDSVAAWPNQPPRTSVEAWMVYAKLIPQTLGYVTAALALCGLIFLALRQTALRQRWLAWLMLGWFGFGYMFFSAIALRESRYVIVILFPLALLAVLALHRALPMRAAQTTAMALGLATVTYSLLFASPPAIKGYRDVADYVARHAPKNAVVLFFGYRDGNFVFNMRTHEERPDIRIVRADKLLVRVAIDRMIRGVQQFDYDEAHIAGMLRELGVDLVVFQPGFWTDLREMARFASVVHTDDFTRVARFDVTGTIDHTDPSIEIYRPTYEVVHARRRLQLDMPTINDRFIGSIGPSY